MDSHGNCIHKESTEKHLFSERRINSSILLVGAGGSSSLISLRFAAAYHHSKKVIFSLLSLELYPRLREMTNCGKCDQLSVAFHLSRPNDSLKDGCLRRPVKISLSTPASGWFWLRVNLIATRLFSYFPFVRSCRAMGTHMLCF